MSDFETTANGISDRIIAEHGEGYGIDPVSIITLVMSILPGILKCWQHNDEVPPVAASDRIKRMHARNPERLRAKLARSISYGAQQKGHHLTVDQCQDMAAAMIAEAVGSSGRSGLRLVQGVPLMLATLLFVGSLLAVGADVALPRVSAPTAPAEPQPEPAIVDTLAVDEWYLIPSSKPLKVIASPDGIVDIEEDAGPLRLRGKFAGGTGLESRTIDAPHVYLITARAAGQIELLIIEADGTLTRQSITVGGAGPRPPPIITVGPVKPIEPPSGLQVMLLIDQGDAVSALAAVNSVPVLQWMDSNTTQTDGRPGWRRWDRSSLSDPDTLATESPTWQKLWADIGGSIPAGPQLVVISGAKVTTRPITSQKQLLQDLQAAKEGRL